MNPQQRTIEQIKREMARGFRLAAEKIEKDEFLVAEFESDRASVILKQTIYELRQTRKLWGFDVTHEK